MQPKVTAAIANFAGFATGNLAAIPLLPNDMKNSKTLYPDPSIMTHAVVEDTQNAQIRTLIEHYWELLKLEA